jgi:hypothetical protein
MEKLGWRKAPTERKWLRLKESETDMLRRDFVISASL